MELAYPSVETKNLTKRFSHVTALAHLNLKVEPGDVLALLGANGSGKSTTFKLLLNIYRPSEGTSSLLGTPSHMLNGRHFEHIGHISENKKMPKWMSIDGFLAYCAGFYPGWDASMCQRLVTGFNLPRKQKIKHLSRGQAMKLAVASIVPAHPKLLLLDEPFSGLDVETRAQLGELLKSLAREEGLAIMITTHDVEEVEPVANRIGILHKGQLKVDETLASYLGRHRVLTSKDLRLETLPEPLRMKFTIAHALPSEARIFTESYTDALGEAVTTALFEQGIEASLQPMNIRQILTAHSLPLV